MVARGPRPGTSRGRHGISCPRFGPGAPVFSVPFHFASAAFSSGSENVWSRRWSFFDCAGFELRETGSESFTVLPTMSELRASVEEPWASFPDASKERGELRVWCEGLECVSVFVRVRDSRRHTQRTWGGVIALVVSPCHSFPRGLLIIPH